MQPRSNINFMSGDFTTYAYYNTSIPRPLTYSDIISIGHDVHCSCNDSSFSPFNNIPNDQISIGNYIVRLDDPYATTIPSTLPNSTAPLNSNGFSESKPPKRSRQGTILTETGSFYPKPKNTESDILLQKRKQPGSRDGGAGGCGEHDKKRWRRSES
jgi:hypothetical protein